MAWTALRPSSGQEPWADLPRVSSVIHKVALVRGHHLQARRFADNRQVGPQPARGQGARTGLALLLIHQPGEDDFGCRRPLRALRQFAQRREHGGHRTFGVAGAAAEEAPVPG